MRRSDKRTRTDWYDNGSVEERGKREKSGDEDGEEPEDSEGDEASIGSKVDGVSEEVETVDDGVVGDIEGVVESVEEEGSRSGEIQ